MKKLPFLLFVFGAAMFTACGPSVPSADEMRAEAEEYERAKAEILANRGKLYLENKSELQEKAANILAIIDTANYYEEAYDDTLYHHDEAVKYVEFDDEEETLTGNYKITWKTSRNGYPSDSELVLQTLVDCGESDDDQACILISDEAIEKLLAVKYVFMDEEMLSWDPHSTGDAFESGIYIGRIVCYDLEEDEAFYQFRYYAENSDVVSIDESSYAMDEDEQLKYDLLKNVGSAKLAEIYAHFDVMN